MAAERRDEMVRQESNEDQEGGEFALKNGGSGPDQMATDSAVILDDLMESRTEIRDWLECPICLGIIKKTRTLVECMHRFCGDCIEQVLKKGMNECPICRRHIPSRTSLKDDANFDGLVEAVCKVVEKCGDKRKAPSDDECGKQTKVRRIIGAPSNQTFSSGSGDGTSDSKFSEPVNPIPNGQINNDEKHVHILPEDLDKETRVGMAERMMECMVLPEVRTRVRELPIEVQDSICSSVYRCIAPYLEVLYLLEEKEGDMKMEVEAYMDRLNQLLHLTVEGLKENLQVKLEQMEMFISTVVGQEDTKKVLESLRDAVSNVESELGKLECGESSVINLMENKYYSPLQATHQVIADLIMISKNEAQTRGWKKWYNSVEEYERDLKDAAAVYYKIGKSAMKKTTCGTILHFCPSFNPSQFNLFR